MRDRPKRSAASPSGSTASSTADAEHGRATPRAKKSLFVRGEAAAKEERTLLQEASEALAAKGSWRGMGNGEGGEQPPAGP